MEQPTCAHCGGPLPERSRRDRRYCSTRCVNAAAWARADKAERAAKTRAWRLAGAEIRRAKHLAAKAGLACVECSRALPAVSPRDRRFCSKKCMNKYLRREQPVEECAVKTCSKCQTAKPRSEFPNDAARSDGLFPWCKECRRAAGRRSHHRNREARIQQMKNHRAANADAIRASDRERYRADPGPKIKQSSRWRVENPDKYSAMMKGVKARRRSRERDGLDSLDRELSRAYRAAIASDLCFYCGSLGEHDDHMTPLARGGTDHWWNLTRACSPCNLAKWTMTADEYILAREGRKAS